MTRGTDSKATTQGMISLLQGNWGEQFVAEKLAACNCFVRHVPQGHDVGIDLYCETTGEDGKPFLHFWCQVKTDSNHKGKKSNVHRKIGQKYIQYWLRQPVPVLVFVVPDLRKEKANPYYVCKLAGLSTSRSDSVEGVRIKNMQELDKFLREDLLLYTCSWGLRTGKVAPIPVPKDDYLVGFLAGATKGFETNIESTLKWASWRLIQDYLHNNGIDLDSPVVSDVREDAISALCHHAQALEAITLGTDDGHHVNYTTLGTFHELAREYEKALTFYGKSLEMLRTDPNLEKRKEWREWRDSEVAEVERYVQRVKRKIEEADNSLTVGEAVVCFLDILGYTDVIDQHNTNANLIKDIENIMTASVEITAKVRNVVSGRFEQEGYRAKLLNFVSVRYVSDSVIFTAHISDIPPFEGVDRDIVISDCLWCCFTSISTFYISFLGRIGLVARGGISMGPHYENDRKKNYFLFSKAYVEAYELQIKENPRIILSDTLVSYLRTNNFPYFDEFIYTDDDDVSCLNFYSFLKQTSQPDRLLNDIKECVEANIRKNSGNLRKREKLVSFVKYHNKNVGEEYHISLPAEEDTGKS